jgi:hypothetical protein
LLFRQFKSNIYQNIKNLSEVFTSVYCIWNDKITYKI